MNKTIALIIGLCGAPIGIFLFGLLFQFLHKMIKNEYYYHVSGESFSGFHYSGFWGSVMEVGFVFTFCTLIIFLVVLAMMTFPAR